MLVTLLSAFLDQWMLSPLGLIVVLLETQCSVAQASLSCVYPWDADNFVAHDACQSKKFLFSTSEIEQTKLIRQTFSQVLFPAWACDIQTEQSSREG